MSSKSDAWDLVGAESSASDEDNNVQEAYGPGKPSAHVFEEEETTPNPSTITHTMEAVVSSDPASLPGDLHTQSSRTSKRSCSRIGFPCRTVDEYEWLEVIDQGTFGVVHKARCLATGDLVALKKVKPTEGQGEGFPTTCLREIMALELLEDCPYVVRLREVVTDAAHWSKAMEKQQSLIAQRTRDGYRAWMAKEAAAHAASGITAEPDAASEPATKKRKSRWGTAPVDDAASAPVSLSTTATATPGAPTSASTMPLAPAPASSLLIDPYLGHNTSALSVARSSSPAGPSARVHALTHVLLAARTAQQPSLLQPTSGRGEDSTTFEAQALGGFTAGPRTSRLQCPPERVVANTSGLSLPYSLPLSARSGPPGGVFLVLDYMPGDLKRVMKRMNTPFPAAEAKCVILQLLRGLAETHARGLLHRDLKPSNLLVDDRGGVKLADFGSARRFDTVDPRFTSPVVTLWYRAPELLLGARTHAPSLDMWSAGCIMAELLLGKPLFTAQGELPLLAAIFRLMGAPNAQQHPSLAALLEGKLVPRAQPGLSGVAALRAMFPRAAFRDVGVLTESGLSLLAGLLELEPTRRLSAADALKHQYFTEAPLPVAPEALHWAGRTHELGAVATKDDFGELRLEACAGVNADDGVVTPEVGYCE